MPPPSMIFHHPLPIDDDPTVGSTRHVAGMLEGFRQAGFEVEVVAGHSAQRAAAMRRIRRQVRSGRRFEFAFAEASTAPTALNDPHHLPLRPLLDWRFLRWMRRRGTPVGLFYPDVYWRFPIYRRSVPWLKRSLAVLMYRYDLAWYRSAVDVLFLPSVRMQPWIPGWVTSSRVEALAPGGTGPCLAPPPTSALRLFYVGSVAAPLYDISPLTAAVAAVDGVHLTVCCPVGSPSIASVDAAHGRIEVVHEHGAALCRRYAASDVACLVFAPEPYRDFAMPVKLFEAIAAGRPVLASAGTAVADFVEATGVGWTAEAGSLPELLATLRDSPSMVEHARASVIAQQVGNTWSSRATMVASSLMRTAGGIA